MEYHNLLGFFHSTCGKRRNDRGLGWLASWNTSVHSCGHNTTHTHACQVSYDTHARCIFTGTMHKACVPPSPMHKACGRSVLRCIWRCILPASPMHIYRSPWCIRPAAVMHKYLAVLRRLMGHFAVLRNKLLSFQSIMLTFMRFHGKLHAKMTINSLIKVFHNFFHSLI